LRNEKCSQFMLKLNKTLRIEKEKKLQINKLQNVNPQ